VAQDPRVGAARQPWAPWRNAVGVRTRRTERSATGVSRRWRSICI